MDLHSLTSWRCALPERELMVRASQEVAVFLNDFALNHTRPLRGARPFIPCVPEVSAGSSAGYRFAGAASTMKGMTIGWWEEPFRCEFRSESAGGWLQMLRGEELVAREPVASVLAAYQRAREISQMLIWKRAKGA